MNYVLDNKNYFTSADCCNCIYFVKIVICNGITISILKIINMLLTPIISKICQQENGSFFMSNIYFVWKETICYSMKYRA